MTKLLASIATAMLLTACTTPGGRYTGMTYYYTDKAGIDHSCREPTPWRGGNCRPLTEWKDIPNGRI